MLREPDGGGSDVLRSPEILSALDDMEDHAWLVWGRSSSPMTGRALARLPGRSASAPLARRREAAIARPAIRRAVLDVERQDAGKQTTLCFTTCSGVGTR